MKISKNWLSEYVKLDCSLEELCNKLTCAGIEVEEISSARIVPHGIVVGKILERKPHPNADSLSVCKVFDGEKELQIVCGAPNCDAGNTIPLATIGTVFPAADGDFEIKKAKLRGVESFGMMCSARELGLSEEHEGLLLLDSSLTAGTSLNDVLKADCCLTVETTPNRPDWLSHYGIARDVACLLDESAHLPMVKLPPVANPLAIDQLVIVEDKELCPRYTARVIRNVKIGESPDWLKERLTSIGLRPINNVVDVTNFILMELGQPLHAFDLDRLTGKRVVARRARNGEKITLLDGREVELADRHLVIADAEKPMALAGVMGGMNSCVESDTVNILIESAVFFSSNIRATARELGVSSDSSYRFERGVDYDMAPFACDRACQLILELAGGELATGLIDVNGGRPQEKEIFCRFDKVRALLGLDVSNQRMVDIFHKLQLKVADISEESCRVTAPLFRLDLTNEADLTEEVARINGLDMIPIHPVTGKVIASLRDDAYLDYQILREELIRIGLFECYHYSTVSDKSALSDSRFEMKDVIRIGNPLSLDLACLRPSLFGEMLATVERNIARRNLNFRLFEMSNVFCANPALYPEERMELCVMLSGQKNPERYSGELKECYDFYDIKGLVETLAGRYKLSSFRIQAGEDARFAPGNCAMVIINGKTAGFFGLLAANLTKGFKTPHPIFSLVLEVGAFLSGARESMLYKPFGMFPATSRDVAFTCDVSLEHAKVLEFIRRAKPEHLEKVELFDIFVDEKLGAGHKSMAYKLTFRHPGRTLTDQEVNTAFDKLRERLANDLNVELR